jgi:hypothetical protein
MPSTAAKSTAPTQQDVCIDLPGETVQCWRSSDNIRVVLRKHRDVIFDLNLGAGKTYTVQATKSDFYNARDKKLVYAKRNDIVTFKDGERLHLWVTRNFDGALILKCGSDILMKLTPNEVDNHQYDNAPKTKPAPIIVALGSPGKINAPALANREKFSPSAPPANVVPSAAPIDEQCSIVCVVDAMMKGAPEIINEHFKKGGGNSIFADIDPFDVATRNWLWGQAVGALTYVDDNWHWLRASLDTRTRQGFKLVSAKLHRVGGRARIYFSGYSRYNTVFGPGGFGPGHERVVNIFAGVGKTASSFAAIAKGIAGSFKGMALVSFIFGTATAIAEWSEDFRKDLYDLAAGLLMAVLKAIISAALTVAIVIVILFLIMGAASSALPVLAVGAITLVAGVAANFGVEAVDKTLGKLVTRKPDNGDGLAGAIAPALRKAGETIQRNWAVLNQMSPQDYQGIAF